MRQESLTAELFTISEVESVVLSIIEEYEHDIVKEKMAKVFEQLSEQAEFEKTLETVEYDIHLCRGLARRVMAYCNKRRDETYDATSTK